MKRLAIFSTALCLLAACSVSGFESLDNEAFERLIATDGVQLVDVRTADEFVTKPHIAGAINIDVKAADFAEQAQALLDKEKKVAVYCQRGRRSKMKRGTTDRTRLRGLRVEHRHRKLAKSQ